MTFVQHKLDGNFILSDRGERRTFVSLPASMWSVSWGRIASVGQGAAPKGATGAGEDDKYRSFSHPGHNLSYRLYLF
jgi:hypothetical protein